MLARARETGILALDTETNSLDANQAELVGLSLALAPGEACYVPLEHRGEDNLFGGGLAPGQLPAGEVIARLKPVLEDRSVLKVGHNVKSDWLVLKRHGIDVAPVRRHPAHLLRARCRPLRPCRPRHGRARRPPSRPQDHRPSRQVAGTGKAAVTFDRVAGRQGDLAMPPRTPT